MNQIQYLIDRIKREIPIALLNVIFLHDTARLGGVPVTLDYVLERDIVRKVLITDLNMIAGKEADIYVGGCPIIQTTTGQIIRIGYGPTSGKEILSVLSVGYGFTQAFSGKPGIASSVSDPVITGDAKVQLVGKNTVYCDGFTGIPISSMKVVLEHSSTLSDVSIRALEYLAKLAVLGAKQHLYVQGMYTLKNAVIKNGVDLPFLESVTESYSDATSMYNDLLPQYHSIAFMSDRTAYTRYLRGMCPS
jgi:hypothetical protein